MEISIDKNIERDFEFKNRFFFVMKVVKSKDKTPEANISTEN